MSATAAKLEDVLANLERLQTAAQELVEAKGRHNTGIAYDRLKTVLADIAGKPAKPWWWARRCCDKAKQGPNCVCTFNTTCPEHGEKHHGSHE
jgi:hypothetical protein